MSLITNQTLYKGSSAQWERIACNAEDTGDVGLIPGSGRFPERENGDPL